MTQVSNDATDLEGASLWTDSSLPSEQLQRVSSTSSVQASLSLTLSHRPPFFMASFLLFFSAARANDRLISPSSKVSRS